jgi:hypothetical protein
MHATNLQRCAASCLLAALLLAGCASSGTGLDGALYWIDDPATKWSPDQWRQQVHYMQRAGFKHILLFNPAYAIEQSPPPPSITAADRFFDAARHTRLRIYLSLWANPIWFARWDIDEELERNAKVLDALVQRYGNHPNFAGWYIPHESYVAWGDQREYLTKLYTGLSRMCKERTPNKPVLLSPFFLLDRDGKLGDFPVVEPPEYEDFWAELLAATDIDIVALQDSGEHLSCYTIEQRRPFLAAMQRACTRAGKQFWINIETAELTVASLDDYVQRFGLKTYVNSPVTQPYWKAVTPEKLKAKLHLAHEFTDTTITWGYQPYWDPMRGQTQEAIYASYVNGTRP